MHVSDNGNRKLKHTPPEEALHIRSVASRAQQHDRCIRIIRGGKKIRPKIAILLIRKTCNNCVSTFLCPLYSEFTLVDSGLFNLDAEG